MALEAAGSNILYRADEIVMSLVTCAKGEDCNGCIFGSMETGCTSRLLSEAAELTQAMQSELERVQKEREAAVEDFKSVLWLLMLR